MNNSRKPRVTINNEIINIIRNQIDREKTEQKMAENNGLSISCVRSIVKKIKDGLNNDEIIRKKGRKFKNSHEIRNAITAVVNEDNSLTQTGYADSLNTLGIQISQSTISRTLKCIGISRKRLSLIPIERNNSRVIELRYNYARELNNYTNEQLVYLDETGFNLHTSNSYGYSFTNTKAYSSVPANKGLNISLMCSITSMGILSYQLQDGAYNGDLFINFIRTHLVPFFAQNPGFVLIMDNCRFHHRLDVKRFLVEKGINFKFLPPYSPQLNPIEEFFGYVKSIYKGIRPLSKTRSEIKDRVKIIMDECEHNLVPYYEKARTLLELALSRQHFL